MVTPVYWGWQTRPAVNTEVENHGGGDEVQQGLIRRQRRYRTATEEMWYGGDGEMGWKNGNGMGKY